MQTINIGGVDVQYEAYADLGEAVQEQLQKLEPRHREIVEEERDLRRKIGKLKEFLGGKETRPKKPVSTSSERVTVAV